VREIKLKHVVITSVTRDDLADGGAKHFARTVEAVRQTCPEVSIELLTSDFKGDVDSLEIVCQARPDVFNHNVETNRRLTAQIRSGADYERSLSVLHYAARHKSSPVVKSGFMLGLGESKAEINETLQDLLSAGVQMLTIGQYLRPSPKQREVQKFYRPEEFEKIETTARNLGFSHVAAGPFVRSSYHAQQHLHKT
jgi:lipoic acid synthetase